ncbi:MAG: EAL domain-containing protein [Myxococcales bacterium]|nr:EAL domain-containing protein [Myxococcales bacterium]MCB9709258.1 EAL domain-containing protein [Myxococcales bacterium]
MVSDVLEPLGSSPRGHRLHRHTRLPEPPANDTSNGTDTAKRVLLIEDDPDHAFLIRRYLISAFNNLDVVHASCLSDALKALHDECSVIVADMGLPDTRGMETVEMLHRAAPETPIVILSSNPSEETALEAVQSGAQDYLPKSELSAHTLRRSIRYALERQHIKKKLSKLAHYDTLTNLVNRSMFHESLSQAVRRSKRVPGYLALMFVDLDCFKEVNDSFGHGVGDRLLVEVARRLEASTRESDIVARLGGDEFAILLESVADYKEVTRIADRVLRNINAPINIASHPLDVRASIGITVADHGIDHTEKVIQRADAAMYQAKAAGRNQYCFFDKHLHKQQRARRRSERALRIAVEQEAFELHYQPQYSLRDGRIMGIEALLRWRRPDGGLVTPREFIHILEEDRLIGDVGRWMFSEACQAIKRWRELGPGVRIAVNISPVQFEDRSFVKGLMDICEKYAVEPSQLQLELTEDALMADIDQAKRAVYELTLLGFTLAIDDFGTGYSSLAYLRQFAVHTLKIDRAFVSGLPGEKVDEPIVTAIVALGACLGCAIVAEGVETQEHETVLKHLGCDAAQGYFYSPPLSEADLRALLAGRFSQN